MAAEPLNRAARWLAWLLRINGVILLTALPATLIPFAWMQAIHESVGLGALPRSPIVEYLARSISLLYALLGAVCFVLAHDVRRYAPLIRLAGGSFVAFGVVMLLIDYIAEMPFVWTSLEGPLLIPLGFLVLWLQGRSRTDR